ncbi:MAG TPA: TetR family transcriptional regulator C-terminal domain-containing protein [Gemmatimonadales bacterium]|nr:TetR family transcriptional regulator C-terminal domain-containing protein [Gemmatimonadales bacterium]
MTRPIGLQGEVAHATKVRLLEAGLNLLLKRGYADTGVQDLLDATKVPKGSFYHHFKNKEDFALQVIDRYMDAVHAALDAILADTYRPPLDRVRGFFEAVRESYASEGYLGCLLGQLGQELSGISPVFRAKIEGCLHAIASRIGICLAEAARQGDLPRETDPRQLGEILVNCWEGAALRSRLLRSPAPLQAVLDFYFRVASPV